MRFLLLLVLVGLVAAWWLGYVPGRPATTGTTTGATSERPIDTEAARERGAKVGEQVAQGVNRVVEGVDDAALTGKIKSKMALDDLVPARDIDVDTLDGVVTLKGRVSSEEARKRAVDLAQQTAGVRSVVDRLTLTR